MSIKSWHKELSKLFRILFPQKKKENNKSDNNNNSASSMCDSPGLSSIPWGGAGN
jgi:hypothetical protein